MDRGELRAALADGLLETRYQPIVRLDTGAPVGLRALARLNHPVVGILLPGLFVPQIEDAGLAAELTDRVTGAAFADMAEGAIANSKADISVAITGVAGPGGGTAEKPVGLVHFAAARRGGATTNEVRRFGDLGRHEIRMASVEVALNLLRWLLA